MVSLQDKTIIWSMHPEIQCFSHILTIPYNAVVVQDMSKMWKKLHSTSEKIHQKCGIWVKQTKSYINKDYKFTIQFTDQSQIMEHNLNVWRLLTELHTSQYSAHYIIEVSTKTETMP